MSGLQLSETEADIYRLASAIEHADGHPCGHVSATIHPLEKRMADAVQNAQEAGIPSIRIAAVVTHARSSIQSLFP